MPHLISQSQQFSGCVQEVSQKASQNARSVRKALQVFMKTLQKWIFLVTSTGTWPQICLSAGLRIHRSGCVKWILYAYWSPTGWHTVSCVSLLTHSSQGPNVWHNRKCFTIVTILVSSFQNSYIALHTLSIPKVPLSSPSNIFCHSNKQVKAAPKSISRKNELTTDKQYIQYTFPEPHLTRNLIRGFSGCWGLPRRSLSALSSIVSTFKKHRQLFRCKN